MNTAEAAKQLGWSRHAVVQAIQSGALEGYGIAGDARTRWFVPADVVEGRLAAAQGVEGELARLRARNRVLEDAVATLREADEKRQRAEVLLRESRALDRQAKDRADEAVAVYAEAAGQLSEFVTRTTIPSHVEDT